MSTPNITASLDAVRNVLTRYMPDKEDAPAVAAVIDVYGVMTAYQLNIAGVSNQQLGDAAIKAMIALTLGWPNNPFIQRHGVAFLHTVGMSVGAVLDGMQYREDSARTRERGDDDKARELSVRALACMNEVTNVAIAAVVLQKGVGYARAKSFQLREDMWNLPKE